MTTKINKSGGVVNSFFEGISKILGIELDALRTSKKRHFGSFFVALQTDYNRRSQWRDRVGFAPTSLFSPCGAPYSTGMFDVKSNSGKTSFFLFYGVIYQRCQQPNVADQPRPEATAQGRLVHP